MYTGRVENEAGERGAAYASPQTTPSGRADRDSWLFPTTFQRSLLVLHNGVINTCSH